MNRKEQYAAKLLDPRWQKKRLEILQRDDFACQQCFDTETTLHVHHRRYLPGREPWDYSDEDLVTLCAPCHEEEGDLWQEEIWSLEETLIRKGYFAADVHELKIAIWNASQHPNIFLDAITFLSERPEELAIVVEKWMNRHKSVPETQEIHE